MKAFKILLISIAASCVLLSCSSAHKLTRQTNTYPWFPFQWYADSISGRYFENLAIVVPIKVNDLKGDFTAQFDLGSNSSSLYGNPLKAYFNSRDEIVRMLDTSKKSDSGTDITYKSKGFKIEVGKTTISDLWYMDQFGTELSKDSIYSGKPKLVGTIGANFSKNKVLIIDYPNKRMCLLDSIDSYWAKRASYVDCIVKKNRIHIPVKSSGKNYKLLFDTGASIFPILTDQTTWHALTGEVERSDTLNISSWGERVKVVGADIKGDIYMGKQKLPKGRVYYTTNKRLLEFNKQEDVDGTTGNAYFLDKIVVIDFKNKRFGVL